MSLHDAFVIRDVNGTYTVRFNLGGAATEALYTPRNKEEAVRLNEALMKLGTVRISLDGSVVTLHP